MFGHCPKKGLSRIDAFRGVYEHERVLKSATAIRKNRLNKCHVFSGRVNEERPKRLSTGIMSPWELYKDTARITPEVVGYEHLPKRPSRRISRSVPDLRSADLASETPVLRWNESNDDIKSNNDTPITSLEYVDVTTESEYSIPSFRYRERHPRLYPDTEFASRGVIDGDGEKRLTPVLNRHPSFLLDRNKKIDKGQNTMSGPHPSSLKINRETHDERNPQVLDRGVRDERIEHTLSRHPSFLKRGKISSRDIKVDAVPRLTEDTVVDVLDRMDESMLSSPTRKSSVSPSSALLRKPSYLDVRDDFKNPSRRSKQDLRAKIYESDTPSLLDSSPQRLHNNHLDKNTRASIVHNSSVTKSHHDILSQRRLEKSNRGDLRMSVDCKTHLASPSATLSGLEPKSPASRMFSSRTTNRSNQNRPRKLSTIQEVTRYEFPEKMPSEMLLSPENAVLADSHVTREVRLEELMPQKFFRRRRSRRISYDDEVDQPEILLRRKVGKVLIPNIFKGNNDEDQSSQSSTDLGQWDIPDWMPKKRAVRRQTRSHEHEHVKTATRRARDMWTNRHAVRSEKRIIYTPPGLSLRRVGKARADTDPLSTAAVSRTKRNRRTNTEGSNLTFAGLATQQHHHKPGRVSFTSTPSSASPRIRRMSDVPLL